VTGSAAAIDNDRDVVGVAPGVTLHAVKVLNGNGSGSFSDIIAGVDWVASEVSALGAPAVGNMSLGGSGSKTGTGTDTGVDYVGGAGTYNLFQWDIPADCTNAPASAWIGLQASGGATDCQWLWASSGEAGAGSSLLNNAGTFTVETFDLQYCINP